MADEISILLTELLLKHSAIYQWNTDDGGPVVFFSAHGDYSYRDLREEGRQIQAKLLEEYRTFSSLLKALLREQPTDVLKQLSQAETTLLRTIEQQHTWSKTTQEALNKALEILQIQLNLVKNLYDP